MSFFLTLDQSPPQWDTLSNIYYICKCSRGLTLNVRTNLHQPFLSRIVCVYQTHNYIGLYLRQNLCKQFLSNRVVSANEETSFYTQRSQHVIQLPNTMFTQRTFFLTSFAAKKSMFGKVCAHHVSQSTHNHTLQRASQSVSC